MTAGKKIHMDDESLRQALARCRLGDGQALAALIAWQMPRIRAAAQAGVCPGLDLEDAVQEGIIALFSAINTYSEEKGASFSTYASSCIRNGILTARRYARRKKHALLNDSVSIEQVQHTAAPEPSPEQTVEMNERLSSTMEGIATRLSSLEREVLLLFLEGASYSTIAKRLNISEKTVDNALQRVRAKLGRV